MFTMIPLNNFSHIEMRPTLNGGSWQLRPITNEYWVLRGQSLVSLEPFDIK